MAQCVLKMQQACAVPGIFCSAAASSSAFYNNSCTSSSPQLLSLSACCNRTTPAATTTTTGGVKQQAWRLASSSSSSSSQIQGTCIIVVSQTIKLHTRRRCILSVRATTEGEGDSAGSSQEKPYGLGGPGTFFGFGRLQELQVGRLAMVGFAAAVIMEVITGKGVLGQLGIDPLVVRFPLLAGFLFLLVGGLLGGYVVINNPPDTSKAPANEGDGLPRDPLKTYDARNLDPLTTYTRGGVVNRPTGQGREPYVSDLDLPPPPSKE
ncbi:hypothetical protein BDL97_01G087700 [Sphagnum fallax]|nr:hypothetical protein BDL97_01G087700 [Sphagnum fallax]